jgi:hypothetical protein
MNVHKYLLAVVLGLGICGGISVEFAQGMDDNTYRGRLEYGYIGDQNYSFEVRQVDGGVIVDPTDYNNSGYTAFGMTRGGVVQLL